MNHRMVDIGAMDMSITQAKAKLTELVRRAEAGEDVVLTRNGAPIVRIEAVAAVRRRKPEDFDALIRDIQAEAARRMLPGPSAARSQDFLYDENGLPV